MPVLWRILGAVERVEAVVLGGVNSNASVSGVPREKVHFVADPECLQPLWQARGDRPSKVPEMAYGKAPSQFIGGHWTGSVRLDSGKNDTTDLLAGAQGMPAETNAKFAWARFLQSWPGGFVSVDPAAVVTAAQPKALPVPPGGAGVAALVDSGAITPTGETNFISLGEEKARQACLMSARTRLPNVPGFSDVDEICLTTSPEKYVIKRAITLPLALDMRLFHFVLPRDVPKPEGNPYADVIWQDTGEPVFSPPNPQQREFRDPAVPLQ